MTLGNIDDDDPPPEASWNNLFGKSRFGQLLVMYIFGLIVNDGEVINFLVQSGSELRTLGLSGARIT